ncbi:MAG: hypothetical protein A2W09_09360 [Deltaproteobacteria bacterium RBG_16_50_11]|nr:MAG: hypothetical protein A2W09_09360 [Deltaproteobacteria bacterium RBG_16_50_11]
MRLFYKLFISYFSLSLFLLLSGYIFNELYQRALQRSSGEIMALLAAELAEMLDNDFRNDVLVIEEYIYDRTLTKGLSESNKKFERLENVDAFINAEDAKWRSVPVGVVTPFMKTLMQNDISKEIREKIDYFNKKDCCPYAEVFVTNRYGAPLAMSGKLSDYRQDDEEWWQVARDTGNYISDVDFDDSSGVYSIQVAVRIDDEAGGFQGVMKVVMDIKHLVHSIAESKPLKYNDRMQYKLLTRDGRMLFSNEQHEFLEDVSTQEFFSHIGNADGYFVADWDRTTEGLEVFSYSHLRDYNKIKGLGWIVVLESPVNVMFGLAAQMKRLFLLFMAAGAVISAAISYLLSRSLSNPAVRLRLAASRLGDGDYNARAEVRSTDEFGALAMTFNTMAEKLERAILSKENELREREKMQGLLEHQANYDTLTGLPNRNLFIRRLVRAIEQKKHDRDYNFAVLFMDLDRFKIINDSLGHSIGDQLLIEVGKRLNTCIRPDDIAARLGGDEFAIFANNIKNARDVLFMVERIQLALAAEFDLIGHKVFCTVSFGVTLSESGYSIAEELIRDSDTAMYRAKTRGGCGCEMFDSEMHTLVKKRLQLETDLRSAINNEELLVNYQPIVSLKTLEATGTEALIRWKHKTLGYIPPAVFIPIAEETGLIQHIGEWILEKACTQNKAWHDKGHRHLHINVNFSIRQFQNYDQVEIVRRVLRDSGMPAQFLTIEITESVIKDTKSIEVLKRIHALGAQNAIDDFGTGYSSLSILTRLSINSLKIDKSFIQNLDGDPNAAAIIKAIIAMAHSLNLIVVAEGVETEEQLEFLRLNRCDEIQGYFVCRPTDEKGLTEFLEKGWTPPSGLRK